nr:MAG: wsv308-like protein [Penaeus monodon endogenous nimavirus]
MSADDIVDRFILDSTRRLLTAAVGIASISPLSPSNPEDAALFSAMLYGTPQVDTRTVFTLANQNRGILEKSLANNVVSALSTARVGVKSQCQRAQDAIDRIENLVFSSSSWPVDQNRLSSILNCIIIAGGRADGSALPLVRKPQTFTILADDTGKDDGDGDRPPTAAMVLAEAIKSLTDETPKDLENMISLVKKNMPDTVREWGDKLVANVGRSAETSRTFSCDNNRYEKLRKAIAVLRSTLSCNLYRGPSQLETPQEVYRIRSALLTCACLLAADRLCRMVNMVMFAINFREPRENIKENNLALIRHRAEKAFYSVPVMTTTKYTPKPIVIRRRSEAETISCLAFIFKCIDPGTIRVIMDWPISSQGNQGLETAIRLSASVLPVGEFQRPWERCISILDMRATVLKDTEELRIDHRDARAALIGPLDVALADAATALELLDRQLEAVYDRMTLTCQLLPEPE